MKLKSRKRISLYNNYSVKKKGESYAVTINHYRQEENSHFYFLGVLITFSKMGFTLLFSFHWHSGNYQYKK